MTLKKKTPTFIEAFLSASPLLRTGEGPGVGALPLKAKLIAVVLPYETPHPSGGEPAERSLPEVQSSA